MAYLASACQGLLVVVLLLSGASKLRSAQALRAVATSLTSMRLVHRNAARPVSGALAVVELVTAVLLAVPATRRVGFAAATVLLAVLAGGVSVIIARGTAAPCRCFGTSLTPLSGRHLVRNLLLTAFALVGFVVPAGDPAMLGSIVALVGGGVAGLLVSMLDDLVALFTPSTTSRRTTDGIPGRSGRPGWTVGGN